MAVYSDVFHSRQEPFLCFGPSVCHVMTGPWRYPSLRLLIHASAWGLTMAAYSSSLPLANYCVDLVKCLIGAFIMRSSACTINDIFDRKMDAGVGAFFTLFEVSYLSWHVERTRNRPLASGRVSVFAATVYLLVQYGIGLMFFFLTVRGLAYVQISRKYREVSS